MTDQPDQQSKRFPFSIHIHRRGILLSLIGIILLVFILLLIPLLFPLFSSRSATPAIFQTTAVVGHDGDSSSHPSYFVAFNLNSQIVVVEFKREDPTTAVQYEVPSTTSISSQDSISVAFSDVTGDGKPDMLIYLNQDFKYAFVNDGIKFRQSTPQDVINQKHLPTELPSSSNFPITQQSAVVGHNGDSPGHPSYFLILNLQSQLVIMEFKSSDPSEAIVYVTSIKLATKDGNQASVTLEFRDINGDGKPDMVVHISPSNSGQPLVFINFGQQFRIAHDSDN